MQAKLRAHIEKIIPLTDDEFAFVLSHFTFRKVKKHQFLIQEGDSVNHSYFVVYGLLKLAHTDANDKEHILHFAMEDWWISDYHAYFTKAKATMSLDCLEDAGVFCISLEDNEKLFAGLPKMEHFFLRKSHFGYIASQQRILSLLTSSAKERYEQLLMQYPSLIQRVNKTLLASYLGISRETLSRLSS
ncbi:cAMP-binding domain of CRP or a regulatory subunit of cAMP-dependent protein kinases [Chitinophaga sp. CF118]|uniref:Crp/Fnr family transcriptional regulator n=1 Tax=Chitinophaga sp. CF118 TaxID=1884367 RepID=UPI0008F10023|nr:Crp/Fnr family transcriptional regulator [Chitinophaga sp. CF118]SFF10196.1 cAMP-binding domain of CRP or a regulatory subunit of cAMP-dependent protein kinases [Chitinophaga sp. CF118]